MKGPAVMLIVLAVAGLLVLAHELAERQREREREFDGIDEWEQVKRDLAPRSIP